MRKLPAMEFLALTRLRSRAGFYSASPSGQTQADLALFKAIVSRAALKTQAWNGKLYFVYLCEKARCAHAGRASAFQRPVLEIVRALGIPVIDSCDILRSRDVLALFQGHYTEAANTLIADDILLPLTGTEITESSGDTRN
jgi:hypothetical protein